MAIVYQSIEELLDPKQRVEELTLLIDGDIYAHRAASVTDGRMYEVPDSAPFKYKKDVEAHCKDKGIDFSEIQVVYYPEPFKHCSASLKSMLQSIEIALAHKAKNLTMQHFLTTKVNFRADILPHYKWNRLGVMEVIRRCGGDEEKARTILRMSEKTFEKQKGIPPHTPEHLLKTKDYLRKKHGAIELPPYEADDLIGMEAGRLRNEGKPHIIVSIDKDLNCIPGLHYNSVNNDLYNVTEEEALYNFYLQCLMGDDTDHIPGIKGCGPKTAQKILDAVEDKSESGYYKAVLNAWGGDEDMLLLSAQCLWILQDGTPDKLEDRLWWPPCAT